MKLRNVTETKKKRPIATKKSNTLTIVNTSAMGVKIDGSTDAKIIARKINIQINIGNLPK